MRSLLLAVVLVPGIAISPAQAGLITSFRTTKDGMNAIRYHGSTYTFNDLTDRRNLNPTRFDHNHHRLGYALSLGRDGLQARRDLNPRRFDTYHPILAYLLDGSGFTGRGDPVDTLPPSLPGPSLDPIPITPIDPVPPITPPDLIPPPGPTPPLDTIIPPIDPLTPLDPAVPIDPVDPTDSEESIDSDPWPEPDLVAVPEPSSLILALTSLLILGGSGLISRVVPRLRRRAGGVPRVRSA
ncbi:hypothetical protein [Tautonia marina]|uniref:hypothetical protein n=1 Tax=Tautonia marina TaxID=2653855 RepID=UPI001260E0E2|nr:hypothetical protein [Tautonia marina]